MSEKGTVTLTANFDLDKTINDEYGTTVRDIIRDELCDLIRGYIRQSLTGQAKRVIRQWTDDYLAGKKPTDSPGMVMIPIPEEWIK